MLCTPHHHRRHQHPPQALPAVPLRDLNTVALQHQQAFLIAALTSDSCSDIVPSLVLALCQMKNEYSFVNEVTPLALHTVPLSSPLR